MTESEVREGLRKLRLHHFQQAKKTQRNYERFVKLSEHDLTQKHRYNMQHSARMLVFHLKQVELLNNFFEHAVEKDE